MNTRKKLSTVFFTLLVLCGLFSSTAIAQEETSTFTEEFDSVNWEGWEHSQDVVVENGILRLGQGGHVVRVESWADIDLSVKLRFSLPGVMVVNYLMGDQGHYALLLAGGEAILDKHTGGEPTNLAGVQVQNFKDGDWNEINIQMLGGEHTITINEQEVITVTDSSTITSGGFMVHALEVASVEVDSISITGIRGAGSPFEGGEPGEEGAPPEGGEPEGEPPPEDRPGEEGGQPIAPALGAGATDGTTEPQSLLEEFMSGQSNQLELSTFLINLLLAVAAAFILGRVYVYWGSSLSNRRAFASNFMLLTVTTTFIILVVRSSVALSLGLVGALSIVRFRAAVKEPEELAYLFFAISLGIGLGDNQRLITLLALLVGITVIGLLRLFRRTGADVNLHLTIASKNPGKVELDQITEVLEKHCSKIKLLRFDETEQVLETSYVIEFKRVSDLSQAKSELQTLSPSMEISFLDNKGIW
jgi:hypothetical protein